MRRRKQTLKIKCRGCHHEAEMPEIDRLIGKTLVCSRCGWRQQVQWNDPNVRAVVLDRFNEKPPTASLH